MALRIFLLALTVALAALAPARGKIIGIDDYVTGDYNRDFGYDLNGRLNIAWGSWGLGSYKYDALGNIRQRVIGSRTVDIAYDAAKNRVASVTDTANPLRSFAHDARGNVVNDGRYTLAGVYPRAGLRPDPGDLADQPVAASGSGVSATYKYDGNRKRIKSVVGGAQTFPIYSALTGGLVLQDALTAGKVTEYFGVGPAQVRIENWGAPVYTLADHLGSPVAAANAAGAVLWRENYAPFGEKLLDPAANRDNTGYTGHVQDDATKLTYMQARYYDPVIGRFYSTDPIDYRDQLNLYAYVGNDPVNATDPNGEAAQFLFKFVVDVAIEAGIQYATTGTVNVGTAVKDAATGLVNPLKTVERARDLAKIAGKVGDASSAGKNVPNPFGKKGGPAHQAKVEEVSQDVKSRGLDVEKELKVDTPGGEKGSRFVDVAGRDPKTGEIKEMHQIGRQTKGDDPVARERRTLDDIECATGCRPEFHAYD